MKKIITTLLFTTFLLSANFESTWKSIQERPYITLPQYTVSYFKLFTNGISNITHDANRTLNSHKDILPTFEKLAHPNGICFKGFWNITQENNFSGYFKQGTLAPIIVRISSAMSNTKSGEIRSFGLAGKLFSTTQPKANSANFFLIDDLGGTNAKFFSDITLTNEPKLSLNFSILNNFFYALEVSKVFSELDMNPTIRQLYEISQMDEKNKKIKTPKYLKLTLKTQTNHSTKDFREELTLKKSQYLLFNILVSENKKKWQQLGTIKLTTSICSFGCDKNLHFHHPKFQ